MYYRTAYGQSTLQGLPKQDMGTLSNVAAGLTYMFERMTHTQLVDGKTNTLALFQAPLFSLLSFPVHYM